MTRILKPSTALPVWKGKAFNVPIPQTRDPFVNTPLLPVGPGKNGAERFWISSWNSLEGTIGVLVDEFGQSRIYRFKNPAFGGFYSAVQEDADTLWLCGWLDFVVRLRLSTGKTETFPTGAPHALVFAGMAFDRATGKLFAAAFPPPHIAAFSFDIKKRKAVKLHREFTPQHYMRCSFPNGDGTHTIVMQCPGLEFLQWNPADDTLSTKCLAQSLDLHHEGPLTYRMIADDRGRRYVPHQGWYDPIAKTFDTAGPRPEKEMPWFARQGSFAYGAEGDHFYEWDLACGKVRSVCVMPHANYLDTQVTASRRLISVNYDGFFARVDAQTGAPECTQKLATDSIGHVDCLIRVDQDRLIGTPFITQRFWEANLKTGRGFDCGKAAPGGGEILEVWNLRNKIYMAAYGGGELVEYDPRYHPNFPENPRVVADAPGGMRPVAKADDGTSLYYSCSANYGNLGSTLTKFDTRTGLASYSENPIPNQQINSMVYSKKEDALLCGGTIHADCGSCPPILDRPAFARISAANFAVLDKADTPQGCTACGILGPAAGGKWLAFCRGDLLQRKNGMFLFEIHAEKLHAPALNELCFLENDGPILYSGHPGKYVRSIGGNVELWNMNNGRPIKTLRRNAGKTYRILVQDTSVYLLEPRRVIVLENCLGRL